ncbi:MAG: hypothetical protein IPK56_11270 [Elusimicrobia bacterium]|nr:hypothetical protein [Elusimicrobiota bacterium]
MPLLRENTFLPRLDTIAPEVWNAKLLYVNYPSNLLSVYGAGVLYEKVNASARKNNILVVHDAAYSGNVHIAPPLSFLQIPGQGTWASSSIPVPRPIT